MITPQDDGRRWLTTVQNVMPICHNVDDKSLTRQTPLKRNHQVSLMHASYLINLLVFLEEVTNYIDSGYPVDVIYFRFRLWQGSSWTFGFEVGCTWYWWWDIEVGWELAKWKKAESGSWWWFFWMARYIKRSPTGICLGASSLHYI